MCYVEYKIFSHNIILRSIWKIFAMIVAVSFETIVMESMYDIARIREILLPSRTKQFVDVPIYMSYSKISLYVLVNM